MTLIYLFALVCNASSQGHGNEKLGLAFLGFFDEFKKVCLSDNDRNVRSTAVSMGLSVNYDIFCFVFY